jgi:hypothetical protein
MRLPIAVVICLFPGPLIAAACAQATAFRYYRDIEMSPLKQEELVAITPDRDIFHYTRAGHPDLRILDSRNIEVPYVLEKMTETRTVHERHTTPTKDISLREKPGGGLEVEVTQDDKYPLAEGIRFITPLANYQQRVQVSGTSDGKNWQSLANDVLIFDYSRYMDVSNQEVALPGNRFRRFRIAISNTTADQESQLLELTRRLKGREESERIETSTIARRPFRIDRIEFWYNVAREERKGDKKSSYPLQSPVRTDPSNSGRQTIIEIRPARLPLTGFEIETSSRNFSRHATVQVRTEPMKDRIAKVIHSDWRDIGSATITAMDFRDLHKKELTVHFPESRREEYRIVIDNRDSPPLDITAVRGEANVYRFVFMAAPGEHYRLVYDSDTTESPVYDTVALSESLARGYQPVDARLGGQTPNADGALSGSLLRDVLNNRVFLGAVIAILAVALAWGLYKAGRRIDQLPKDST